MAICVFVIVLCIGLIFQTDDAYARVSLSELLAKIEALEAKLASVSVDGNTVRFTGVNVQIVNGLGNTWTKDGSGNLIVGYNESRAPDGTDVRTGSHNIVVGRELSYYSYGGIVAGRKNTIQGPYSCVSGGLYNTASATYSSVSGGSRNIARNWDTSVTGGTYNTAAGHTSSVSGGNGHGALSDYDWKAGYGYFCEAHYMKSKIRSG